MISRSNQRYIPPYRAVPKYDAATNLTSAESLHDWLKGVSSGNTLYVKVDKNNQKFVSSHKHSQRQPFARRFGSHQAEKLTFVNVVYGLALRHSEHADLEVQDAANELLTLSKSGEAHELKNTKQLRRAIEVLARAAQATEKASDSSTDSESIEVNPADEPLVRLSGDMFRSNADKLERAREQLHSRANTGSTQALPADEPLVELESNAPRFMGKPGYLDAFRTPRPLKAESAKAVPAEKPVKSLWEDGTFSANRDMRALARHQLHSRDETVAMAARLWLEMDAEQSQ